MKTLSVIGLLVLVFSINAFGQQSETSLCSNGYSIFYLNGINNEPTDVHKNAARVKQILGDSFNGEPVIVQASINPSSVAGDLLEVFAQKLAEDPTLSWQLFFRWVTGDFINSILRNALEDFFGTTGIMDPSVKTIMYRV